MITAPCDGEASFLVSLQLPADARIVQIVAADYPDVTASSFAYALCKKHTAQTCDRRTRKAFRWGVIALKATDEEACEAERLMLDACP